MATNPARFFIAIYLDADVNVRLASAIRDEGFDAISAREIGNDFLSDAQQLAFAAAEQRTLLTHNLGDLRDCMMNIYVTGKYIMGLSSPNNCPSGRCCDAA